MFRLIMLIAAAVLAYGGYSYWRDRHAPPEAPKVAAEEPATPALLPTPKSAPLPTLPPETKSDLPPPPVVPQRHLAPAGVFYALRAISVPTQDGVRGIREGTKLTLIKDNGLTLRLTDGQTPFDVDRSLVTNDLDLAGQISRQQSAQAAARVQWQSQQQQIAAQQSANQVVGEVARDQRIQEMQAQTAAATEARAQRLAEIRAQIKSEEVIKADHYHPGYTHQKWMDMHNDNIRQLQMEMGRLGVVGATLERR